MKIIFKEQQTIGTWKTRWYRPLRYSDGAIYGDTVEESNRTVNCTVTAYWDRKTGVLYTTSSTNIDYAEWLPESMPHLFDLITDKALAIRTSIRTADGWCAWLKTLIPPPDERDRDQVKADWQAAQKQGG